jgi:uncharacterized protein YnzC (UPF0291/DUF896 family)
LTSYVAAKHLLFSFPVMTDPQLTIPKLKSLPETLLRDGAVHLELEQGIVIFRASAIVKERINELLDKQKIGQLTAAEARELLEYEEVDDYLSHVNRLIRNLSQSSGVDLAA